LFFLAIEQATASDELCKVGLEGLYIYKFCDSIEHLKHYKKTLLNEIFFADFHTCTELLRTEKILILLSLHTLKNITIEPYIGFYSRFRILNAYC
jgi:hypothetical protein